MRAENLYQELDEYFRIDECGERDWITTMSTMLEHLADNFKKKQKGLVLDNTSVVDSICTATFASNSVIDDILNSGKNNVLLVVHHPMEWVVKGQGEDRVPEFVGISRDRLDKMKEQSISLYALHVPLDWNSDLSTSVSFARSLGGQWQKGLDFYDYHDIKVGVVAKV